MARSRIYLPKLPSPPATIVDYLVQRFPHVPGSAWRDRMTRGMVTTGAGEPLRTDSPYCHGLMVFYDREVPFEPECEREEIILYQDDEILVADKPHGMPVTPSGRHVARALLNRLERRTGIDSLAPLHRLDRDTSGLVLFGIKPESRAHYHRLFASGTIEREYVAVAKITDVPSTRHWLVQNRLEPGEPWFLQKVVEQGVANARTSIDLVDTCSGLGLFRLTPHTGRKHQLRVHMNSLGFPILGDRLYPEVLETAPSAPPLQLCASRLAFTDPLTGFKREFVSTNQLLHAWQPSL